MSSNLNDETQQFCLWLGNSLGLDKVNATAWPPGGPSDLCASGFFSCSSIWVRLTAPSAFATVPAALSEADSLPANFIWSRVLLTSIDLSGSAQLTGDLPRWIEQLSQLDTINLSGTAVTGLLPSSWRNMKYLSTVNLEGSRVSGPIPISWSALGTLEFLFLGNTAVCGGLPPATFKGLAIIDVSNTAVTGPLSLLWEHAYGYGDFRGTRLCGCVPDALKDGRRLLVDPAMSAPDCATANACDNAYMQEGQCPGYPGASKVELLNRDTSDFVKALGYAMRLSSQGDGWPAYESGWFDVCATRYFTCNGDGTVEAHFSDFKRPVAYSDTTFTGDWSQVHLTNLSFTRVTTLRSGLYASFGNLVNLRSMSFDAVSFTGPIPSAWAGLKSLTNLALENTAACGMLPDELPPNLQVLKLTNNKLVGPIPYWWFRHTFNAFDVSGNSGLCGRVPDTWSGRAQRLLDAKYTDTGACTASSVARQCDSTYKPPQEDRALPNEATTKFCTALSASWPEAVPEMFCAAKYFRCAWNGTVMVDAPDAFGSAAVELPSFSDLDVAWSDVNVTGIDLADNPQLSGELPQQWGGLAGMLALNISNTSVSGDLPPAWGGMNSLVWLDLSSSKVSGLLPDTWTDMPAVQSIDLSRTDVGGPFPESWRSFPSLTQLLLAKTKVCGQLPASLYNTTREFDVSDSFLIGKIPESWGITNPNMFARVTGNDLCGCLPDGLTTYYVAADDLLTDVMACPTLNRCTPERLTQTCPLPPDDETSTATSSTTSSTPNPAPETSSTTSSTPNPVTDPSSTTSTTPNPVAPTPGTSAALPRPTHNFCTFVLRKLGLMAEPSSTRANTATTAAAATTVLKADADYCITGNYVTCGTDGNVQITINGVFTTGAGVAMPDFAELDIDWPGATVTSIDMSNNPAMTGVLPAAWGRLTGLRSVDLSSTALSGRLPAEWSGMSSLQSLKISGAQLSGALPDTWKFLNTLTALDLSNNRLCGAVPEPFLPVSVRRLDLHGNSLVGLVPASWNQQPFTQFDVSSNLFCDCVPVAFAGLATPQKLKDASANCDPANACSPDSAVQVCEGYVVPETPGGGGGGVCGGSTAGIVVGVIGGLALLLVLIGLLVWCLCFRRSRAHPQRVAQAVIEPSSPFDHATEPFDEQASASPAAKRDPEHLPTPRKPTKKD